MKYNCSAGAPLRRSDLVADFKDLGVAEEVVEQVVQKMAEIARQIRMQTYLELLGAVGKTAYKPHGGMLPGNYVGSGPWMRAMSQQFEKAEFERQQEYFSKRTTKSLLDL